jgi:outer membrane lipoprotein SlyB
MKTITTGIFTSRNDAEKAIQKLQEKLSIPKSDISFVYQNNERDIDEDTKVASGEVESSPSGDATVAGAVMGGSLGVLAGIAAVTGLIPVVGPIFAAGPLLTSLGIGIGAVGTATATGAVAGGLLGALVEWGVPEERAREYERRVEAGDIFVTVSAEQGVHVTDVLTSNRAHSVDSYSV